MQDVSTKDLKKLKRADLLEMLIEQSKEVERLKTTVSELEQKLSEREIQISESGSLAEAALKLNGVFEAAEAAAKQYLYNLEQRKQDNK